MMAESVAVTLAAVVALVESRNNPNAMRFEPDLYHRIQTRLRLLPIDSLILDMRRRVALIHGCSFDTACMILATSWGKFQLLGENIYDSQILPGRYPYNCTVVQFLNSPPLQEVMFNSFLVRRGIDFTIFGIMDDESLRNAFIEVYNGPGDVAGYWAAMQRVIATLGPVG
jgi:hypothetical protein